MIVAEQHNNQAASLLLYTTTNITRCERQQLYSVKKWQTVALGLDGTRCRGVGVGVFMVGLLEAEDRATYKYVWSRSSAKRASQGLEEIRRLSKDELLLLLKIC